MKWILPISSCCRCRTKGADRLGIARRRSVIDQRVVRLHVRVVRRSGGRRAVLVSSRVTAAARPSYTNSIATGKRGGSFAVCRRCTPASVASTICLCHFRWFVSITTSTADSWKCRIFIGVEAILFHLLSAELFSILSLLPFSPPEEQCQDDQGNSGYRNDYCYRDSTSGG